MSAHRVKVKRNLSQVASRRPRPPFTAKTHPPPPPRPHAGATWYVSTRSSSSCRGATGERRLWPADRREDSRAGLSLRWRGFRASRRISSHLVASRRISSHLVASHRISSRLGASRRNLGASRRISRLPVDPRDRVQRQVRLEGDIAAIDLDARDAAARRYRQVRRGGDEESLLNRARARETPLPAAPSPPSDQSGERGTVALRHEARCTCQCCPGLLSARPMGGRCLCCYGIDSTRASRTGVDPESCGGRCELLMT